MRSGERIKAADRWLDGLIIWTFVAAGLAPVVPRVMDLPLLDQIPYLQFLLFLPAVIVGGLRYLADLRAFRAGPMIAIFAVMVTGLLWVDASERGRGMVEIALIAVPVALAVLLQRRREWLLGVCVYVVAASVAAVYLFYDWLGQAERTGLKTDRYGGLYDTNVVRIMEPNITATHLAFGVLLIAILWVAPVLGATERRWRLVATMCLPVLLTGVVLSGSRGGSLSLLGAVTVLAAFTSVRRSLSVRTNALGAILLLAVAVLLFVAPNPVSHRLSVSSVAVESGGAVMSGALNTSDQATGGSNVAKVNVSDTANFGGRTDIWKAAIEASGSGSRHLLIGAGTGGADHAVAVANPDLVIAKVGEHNVLRANAHNTYLYWLVSFGVVGVIIGGAALAVIAWYALGNDWRQNWGAGTAMLAFFLLTSVTLIANRLEVTSIALSALTFGYILPAPDQQVRAATPKAFWGRLPWV